MTGRVVHFEIPADDPDRAYAFYRDAFGWSITPMPEMQYAMVGTGPSDETGRPAERGAINGGMLRRQDPVAGPVITVEVDDMDQALATVERLGGKVLRGRTAVGTMGFSGYVTDSEDNVVGLWEPAG